MRNKYDYFIQFNESKEKLKLSKKEAYKELEKVVTKEIDNIGGFGISIVDYKHIDKIFRRLENGCSLYVLVGVVSISRNRRLENEKLR